jgi:NTP pyrophosphatase (non-canonical NTP hydrolase)
MMADASVSQTIDGLVKQSYDNAASHGFWDASETPETIPSKLMLIVSEISEALESYRDPRSDEMIKVPASIVEKLIGQDADEEASDDYLEAWNALNDIYGKWILKPRGLDIELADALIRIFDLAGAKGIDLDAALVRKMEYNRGREKMHGGRLV